MKLSPTQRKVLERMAAGERIEIATARNGWRWQWWVGQSTRAALLAAGCITEGGTLGRSWYEITNLGRDALTRASKEEYR